MRPQFLIVADGANVTAQIADRLLDLSVTDNAGEEADQLSLRLDNRDGRLEVPAHQAELTVSLGMAGAGLYPMGSWLVDSTELSGPPDTLFIGATAADMSAAIRAPRTQMWEQTQLGDLVSEIAERAGLTPVVGNDLSDVAIPAIAQTAESDLHFLTRVARQFSAVAKPVAGRLVLARRGGPQTASGEATPVSLVNVSELSRWNWRSEDRGHYGSVEASWQEPGTATTHKVIIGDNTPRRVLRHVYNSEIEASNAASSALDDSERGTQSGSLNFAGFRPELFAGGRILFAGVQPIAQGEWVISRCAHTLNTSLITQIDIERPAGADT